MIQKTPVMASTVAKLDKPVQRVVASAKPSIVSKVTNHPSATQRVLASAQKPTVAKSSPKTDVFSVQVASFARQDNALFLVHTLQQKGFKATYDKQGSQYRVLVGELGQRDEARYLQQKLASTTQLTGFIVKVG
jgi:DedD protein